MEYVERHQYERYVLRILDSINLWGHRHISHICRWQMSLAPSLSLTPALRASFPIAKSTTPAVAGSIRRLPGVASRGCATLTPGCVLAPFQGAHSHRQGVAVRPGVRSFPSLTFKPLDRAIVRLFLVVANAD